MPAAPRQLLDEHIWEGLAVALRDHGYDAIHLNMTAWRSSSDEEVLKIAASESRTVLTYNHKDFVPLVRSWYEARQSHAGVILSIQLKQGELLRQTLNLLRTVAAPELENTVRWLQEFR
jgi:predicted nuclease of predicted toxin-antitoxin system